MKVTESDRELIERYIDGTASESDKALFEKRCEDPAFHEEFVIARAVIDQLVAWERNRLRSDLRLELETVKLQERTSYRTRMLTIYGIAAAVALLLLAINYFLPTRISDNQLFSAYYAPFPVASTRGENDEEWKVLYAQGNYESAALVLQKLVESGDPGPLLFLVQGNCYLNLNRVDEAKDAFMLVMESHDESLSQHAGWYFALACLKEGDRTTCLETLKKLSSGPYAHKARELIDKLD